MSESTSAITGKDKQHIADEEKSIFFNFTL